MAPSVTNLFDRADSQLAVFYSLLLSNCNMKITIVPSLPHALNYSKIIFLSVCM